MGFRDSNQDLVGFVHQIPTRARQRIIDIASTQFPDGGCYHQYQPLTKRGNNDIGGGFNDDPCWLIFGTVAYIKETGDFSIPIRRLWATLSFLPSFCRHPLYKIVSDFFKTGLIHLKFVDDGTVLKMDNIRTTI